ncbi:MAG TPA: TldD/PmbA family protein [Nitrososphaera sp.]|jgi:PmbA protein|nr:TldD/PmbA family protein [Nitrososphaera sp.]
MHSNDRRTARVILDLLEYAVKQVETLGARDAEAYGAINNESEVFIENNDVKQAKSQRTSSIGIRAVLNGSIGFYSTNNLAKSKIRDAAAMAIKIAHAGPRDRHNVLPARSKSKSKSLRGIYDKNADSFQTLDAVKMADEMLKSAKSYDSRVSVDSGNFSAEVATHALANSNGIELKEKASIFSWSIMGMAIEDTEISSFDYQVGGSHYIKDIDVSNTATEFAQTVVNSLGTHKLEESFKGEMLLTPMAANEMIEEAIAHAINSDAMQKKSSHFAGKIGKQVASDLLTVEDDATNVQGLNASSFDREGVFHRRNVVIEKGILKKFLYNTHTASKDGVRSTGNAGGSTSSPPTVSTTNFLVKPMRSSIDTLVSEIDKGIIISRFSGNVNPVNGDFSGVVKGGRLVMNGTIRHAVREVMVAGNVFEALRRLNGISRERKTIYGSILPYMRFDGISFTTG